MNPPESEIDAAEARRRLEADGRVDHPPTRRDFLRLMGASAALASVAGLPGCARPPKGRIVPYVRPPEQVIPGKPLYFATAMPWHGYARGVVVESHEGRPTKIEGNPDHPDSLGATDVFMQASVLQLYDPDRAQTVLHQGQVATWGAFDAELAARMQSHRASAGRGLCILTQTVTSPTLADQLRDLLTALPQARWHAYDPLNRDNARAGAILAFGEDVNCVYHFDKARVILSLDDDFLLWHPGSLRYARAFADARRVNAQTGAKSMNRLYVAEGTPTITGAAADHRLPLASGQIALLAAHLQQKLADAKSAGSPPSTAPWSAWIDAVAADLAANPRAGLILAGAGQPPQVHAVAHALNQQLQNAQTTVAYTAPIEAEARDHRESLDELIADMRAGRVDTLLILGGNPVYAAPADVDFAGALQNVPWRAHLGLYADETSALCQWHLPQTHYLEEWSDARASDGAVSIIQPLIAPLYEGRSAHELLAVLSGQTAASGYEIVRGAWSAGHPENFEQWWTAALQKGVIADSALAQGSRQLVAERREPPPPPAPSGALELIFRPDPSVADGEFSNNAWLQELPKPLTHLVWDNAALISPRLADRLAIANGDMLELTTAGRAMTAPAWITPGQPADTVTLSLGYGRTRAGRVGGAGSDTVGFNAYLLRTSANPWHAADLTLRKTGDRHDLISTHNHFNIDQPPVVTNADQPAAPDNRRLVRVATLGEFLAHPNFATAAESTRRPLQLFPSQNYSQGHQWGMSIDLTSCIGCNACVVACQAENNIAVVGKDQVSRGREMHWIRIDTYFTGPDDNPSTHHQPLPCMHCENAPCELVCPVEATVHDDEGINDMVYNRCVGTRYCSNNCPYKVRHFNFYQYGDMDTPSLKMQRNPNVTVRTRGVMEKCTYCIQRINATRIEAEVQQVKDEQLAGLARTDDERQKILADSAARRRALMGGLQTACQQACPTQAIIFGDINDPRSPVTRLKAQPLDYSLLEELTTRPRTTYLARLTNPNPGLAAKEGA